MLKTTNTLVIDWLRSSRLLFPILILVTFLLFTTITSYSIKSRIHEHATRMTRKMTVIESFVNATMEDTKQIMFGIAAIMTQDLAQSDIYNIDRIVGGFTSRFNNYRTIPLVDFKALDKNDIIIASSPEHLKLFPAEEVNSDDDIIKAAKLNPYEFQIGNIRYQHYNNKPLIPFCIGMTTPNGYVGTLCSGLDVEIINQKLNKAFSTVKGVNKNIKLIDKYGVEEEQIKLHGISYLYGKNKITDYYFNNKYIYWELPNYPMLLTKIEANFHPLLYEISYDILRNLIGFIIVIIFSYYILKKHKNLYQKPFNTLHQKISSLPKDITQNINIAEREKTLSLFESINNIVDYCHMLHQKTQGSLIQQQALEVRNNILHLILTERHYSKNYFTSNIDIATLYLGQVKRLINEKPRTISLKKFLEGIAEYCCEYYSELSITTQVDQNDNKEFTLKHAAFTETVFHIFTLIIRSGKFDISEEKILIKGTFLNNDDELPYISIEASLSDPSSKSSGWLSGPDFTYPGFLSIYLLAKETNLIFDIKQKGNNIEFILNPVSDKALQEIKEMHLSLA